ncbi:MAG: hypothetical protein ACI9MC_002089, partial [Kiritimatiellia bacterium]
MRALLRLVLCTMLTLAPSNAMADRPVDRAVQAELDRTRAKMANQVQLSTYDLVDELVYGWTVDPVFDKPTPVVVAGITVPVGLGTGMQALVENHLSALVIENPNTNIRLVACPTCTQVIVQSGPDATVVSRGIDNPSVLQKLGSQTGRHALFVDVEAEGTFLVLRARLTRLEPDLPIVWSHTIATSASTPALLRQPGHLKSAAEAREEYMAALRDRGPLGFISHVGIRAYARPDGDFGSGTPPPPFLWVQMGVELGTSEALDWTASMVVGGSFIPQAYQGLMLEMRVNRLLTGRARSHTRPDIYFFGGGSVQTVWGAATQPFQVEPVDASAILLA